MKTRKAIQGVTLIELMVVVVVLAILASIATSSYRRQMIRANRAEAQMALLQIRTAQEKFFLQNNMYAQSGDLTTAPPVGLGVPAVTPNGHYAVSMVVPPDRLSYTAQADAAGGQTEDTPCLIMTINDQGQRTPAGTVCWR
jgi:type IV pilus assembly protein PilE